VVAGNILADPTDAAHLAVVWSDMRNSRVPLPDLNPYDVSTNSDIVVSQSFDAGRTWSTPVALALANDQFQPWGAYDSAGLLRIGYFDRSYDPANDKFGYSLATETAPGSLAFTTKQLTTRLSQPTMDDRGSRSSPSIRPSRSPPSSSATTAGLPPTPTAAWSRSGPTCATQPTSPATPGPGKTRSSRAQADGTSTSARISAPGRLCSGRRVTARTAVGATLAGR
jgi:hypothetical protein